MPGDPQTRTADLLAEAAAGYESLLSRIVRGRAGNCPPTIRSLAVLLDDPALWRTRGRLFSDPLLIEALHACGSGVPRIGAPHFPGAIGDGRAASGNVSPDRLGSILLPLLLRRDRAWCGTLESSTDRFGRLQFPLCDWSIVLQRHSRRPTEVLANERVLLQADASGLHFRLTGADDISFLRLTRDGGQRMLVDNNPELSSSDARLANGVLRPRIQFASALHLGGVRFDAVCFKDLRAHAGLTGAIVAAVLAAMHEVSPVVGEEFCSCMHSIRGFELPRLSGGAIQSFSTPSLPRVMSINVPYTAHDDPQLDPLCFTWFGHELAHTKHYLIDAVAYGNGWTFLTNPDEPGPPIPRYGRSLPVRTLFQLPYTHLYEWVLLMDFMEADWHGLPWDVDADPIAAGEELRSEIEEGFDLIAGCARLTTWGRFAVKHFAKLFRQAATRWQRQSCAPA